MRLCLYERVHVHPGCSASSDIGMDTPDASRRDMNVPLCPPPSNVENVARWATEVEAMLSSSETALGSELTLLRERVDIFARQLSPSISVLEDCIEDNMSDERVPELRRRLDVFVAALDRCDHLGKLIDLAERQPDKIKIGAGAAKVEEDDVTEFNVTDLRVKRASLRPSQTTECVDMSSSSRASVVARGGGSPASTTDTSMVVRTQPRRRRITSIAEGMEGIDGGDDSDGYSLTPPDSATARAAAQQGRGPPRRSLSASLAGGDKNEALYNDLGVGRISFVCQDMNVAHNLYNTERKEERETEKRRRGSISMGVSPLLLPSPSQDGHGDGESDASLKYHGRRRVSFANITQSSVLVS